MAAIGGVVACTAEHDEKQRQAQAAAQAAAGIVPASADQPSAFAQQLPTGLKIPSMPKGWKPGMPIPGDHILLAAGLHTAHHLLILGDCMHIVLALCLLY